jgi:hypothetical protein
MTIDLRPSTFYVVKYIYSTNRKESKHERRKKQAGI